jgi:nucleoside-diphosphate-sugar epimerase
MRVLVAGATGALGRHLVVRPGATAGEETDLTVWHTYSTGSGTARNDTA